MYMDTSSTFAAPFHSAGDMFFSESQNRLCFSPSMGLNSPLLPIAGSHLTMSYPGSPSFSNPFPLTSPQRSGGLRLTPSAFNTMFSPNRSRTHCLEEKGDSIRQRLQYVGMIDDPIVVSGSFVSQPCTPVKRPNKHKGNDLYEKIKTPMRLQYRLKQQCGRRKPFLLRSPIRAFRKADATLKEKLSRFAFVC